MKSSDQSAFRRQVALVVAGVVVLLLFLGLAVWLRPAPSLEGGTRLNYVMDLERSLADGRISQREFDNSSELMRRTTDIIEHRLNPRFSAAPRGTRVVAVDSNHFTVELPPFTNGEKGEKAERMAQVRSIIESSARLEVYIGAEIDSLEFDLAAERDRVLSWVEQNPGVSMVKYNALALEDGGAPARLRWFPRRISSHAEPDEHISMKQRLAPLIVQEERFRYRSGDFQSVGVSSDSVGLPAVLLELVDSRKAAFTRLTREHVGDPLAIVFDDEILVLATINEELNGSFIINGGARGFRIAEVSHFVKLLRVGSLAAKPELVSQELITEPLSK